MWFAPKLHFLVAPKPIESFLDNKSRSTNNQPLSSSWGDLTVLWRCMRKQFVSISGKTGHGNSSNVTVGWLPHFIIQSVSDSSSLLIVVVYKLNRPASLEIIR